MSESANKHVSADIIVEISNFLTLGEYDNALMLLNDLVKAPDLEDNIWDLLSKVCDYLTPKASTELRNCCETIILKIINNSQTEEATLEIIEQAESSEGNQVRFIALQKALKICLYKLSKRGLWLDWCLNAIESHIATLQISEERDIVDAVEKQDDPTYTEIIDVYLCTIEFYKSFIYEDNTPFSLAQDEDNHQRKSLTCFLLHLLGKPMMNLNLESQEKKTRAREIVEELVLDLSNLVGDLFMFLNYVELREMQRRSKYKEFPAGSEYDESEIPIDDYLREDRVTTLSLGVFYYLILAEKIELNRIPHVYNPLYILQSCLYLATILLKKNDEGHVVRKGLLLAKSVLSRLTNLTVPFESLGSAVHKEFSEALTIAAIYSDNLDTRKLSISVLKDYIFKFDMKGRYFVMLNLVLLVDHSSLIGYLTMLLKDMIIEAINGDPVPVYFCGRKLIGLLKEFIKLPGGDRCDLAENRDRVLAALNLLLFLMSRDDKNVTGVWDNVVCIEELCLDPLQKALEMSKTHYKMKMTELVGGKKPQQSEIEGATFSVSTLGGDSIEAPSESAQADAIQFALNGFDLMENLLVMLKKKIETGIL